MRAIHFRAPIFAESKIARDFKNEIAQKEYTSSKAENVRRYAQVGVHSEGSKPYIDTVNVSQDI